MFFPFPSEQFVFSFNVSFRGCILRRPPHTPEVFLLNKWACSHVSSLGNLIWKGILTCALYILYTLNCFLRWCFTFYRGKSPFFTSIWFRICLDLFPSICLKQIQVPIGSIYGIFTYIYHKNRPNVGQYTIHGSYGVICIYIFHGSFSLTREKFYTRSWVTFPKVRDRLIEPRLGRLPKFWPTDLGPKNNRYKWSERSPRSGLKNTWVCHEFVSPYWRELWLTPIYNWMRGPTLYSFIASKNIRRLGKCWWWIKDQCPLAYTG